MEDFDSYTDWKALRDSQSWTTTGGPTIGGSFGAAQTKQLRIHGSVNQANSVDNFTLRDISNGFVYYDFVVRAVESQVAELSAYTGGEGAYIGVYLKAGQDSSFAYPFTLACFRPDGTLTSMHNKWSAENQIIVDEAYDSQWYRFHVGVNFTNGEWSLVVTSKAGSKDNQDEEVLINQSGVDLISRADSRFLQELSNVSFRVRCIRQIEHTRYMAHLDDYAVSNSDIIRNNDLYVYKTEIYSVGDLGDTAIAAPSEGTMKFKVKVKNTNSVGSGAEVSEKEDATLIVALYDGNVLKKVGTITTTGVLPLGGTRELDNQLVIPEGSAGNTVRLFVWDTLWGLAPKGDIKAFTVVTPE